MQASLWYSGSGRGACTRRLHATSIIQLASLQVDCGIINPRINTSELQQMAIESAVTNTYLAQGSGHEGFLRFDFCGRKREASLLEDGPSTRVIHCAEEGPLHGRRSHWW